MRQRSTAKSSAEIKQNPRQKSLKGFTLTEVLITLVIIGVIAAMTIPGIIQSTQEQEFVTALKKTSSTLNNAVNLIKINEGVSPDEWEWGSSRSIMIDKLLPYLNYVKVCKTGENCQNDNIKPKNKKGEGNIYAGREAVILNDGIIINAYFASPLEFKTNGVTKKIIGEYTVDVNGHKGPNIVGTDVFYFLLTNEGIIPTGSKNLENINWSWPFDFENGCLNSNSQGAGCTSWVLTHSNLDYLHCPDKIRAGKTSCKKK